MLIQVIGTGCDACDRLYANVLAAVDDMGIKAEIQRVEDLIDIVQLGVLTAPTLMVDGKVVLAGRVAGKGEIRGFLCT